MISGLFLIGFLVLSALIVSPHLFSFTTLFVASLRGAEINKKQATYIIGLSLLLLFVFAAIPALFYIYLLTLLPLEVSGYFGIILGITGVIMGIYFIYQGIQEKHHIHARLLRRLYRISNSKKLTQIGAKSGLLLIEGTLELSFILFALLALLFHLEAHTLSTLAYLYGISLLIVPTLLCCMFIADTQTAALQNWVDRHLNELFIYTGLVTILLGWLVLLSLGGMLYVG